MKTSDDTACINNENLCDNLTYPYIGTTFARKNGTRYERMREELHIPGTQNHALKRESSEIMMATPTELGTMQLIVCSGLDQSNQEVDME